MVTAVTNYGRSGLHDWVLQRATAIVLLAYFVTVFAYIVCAGEDLTYQVWSGFMGCTAMKIFTTIALLSTAIHAWIGMWAVLTDYVTDRVLSLKLGLNLGAKATVLRIFLQAGCILLCVVYVLWGLEIVWSI